MRDDTDRPRDGKDPSTRGHLRLVHPAPPSKPDPTPRTRSGRRVPYQQALFSAEEEAKLRAALRNARATFGSWRALSAAMRVPVEALEDCLRGRHRVSGAIAISLSRALGVPLEALLRGPVDAATCPTCGARKAP
jgi:hypothetical protein